jgi:hypothetical protein
MISKYEKSKIEELVSLQIEHMYEQFGIRRTETYKENLISIYVGQVASGECSITTIENDINVMKNYLNRDSDENQ